MHVLAMGLAEKVVHHRPPELVQTSDYVLGDVLKSEMRFFLVTLNHGEVHRLQLNYSAFNKLRSYEWGLSLSFKKPTRSLKAIAWC